MRTARCLLTLVCFVLLSGLQLSNEKRPALAQTDPNEYCFPGAAIKDIAFSPDGTFIAAVSSEYSTVPMWNVETGRKAKDFVLSYKPPYGLFYVAFSPDGKNIAASTETEVVLWDVQSGQQTHILDIKQEESHGLKIAFTPDSKYILVSGQFGGSLWKIATKKEVQSYLIPLSSVDITVQLSPDGKYVLINGDKDATLRDTQTGKIVHRFNFDVWTETFFSPDGSYIFIKTADVQKNAIIGTLWDAKTYKQINDFDAAAWWQISPNSKYLFGVSEKPLSYKLWNIQTGKRLDQFEFKSTANSNFSEFLPDGEHLLLPVDTPNSSTYIIWDIPANKEVHKIVLERDVIRHVNFSPNGSLMATTGLGSLYLWDTQTYAQIRRIC
jgi:WD40 repeat protein